MTDREIIDAGYTEYKPSPILHHKSVMKCFQKLFRDENGKKYFIDINKHEGWVHPHTGQEYPPTYEFTVQLNYKKNKCPINFELFAGWTIDDVEEFVETLFKTKMFQYYEKF